jgi:DsbC/DsbD-like thiol-disulfide interchange protein
MLPCLLAIPALVAPAAPQESPKVQAALVAEHETLAPGKTAWIGIRMEIEPGWHTYWKGRNTTGTPPIIRWKLPQGYKVGEVLWPGPKRYIAYGDSLDHVHEGKVLLMAPLEVPADAQPGTRIELEAECMFVVCQDICLMEKSRHTLSLKVGESDPKPGPAAKLFEQTRKALPVPLEKAEGVKARVEKSSLVIEAPDAQRISFFPAEDSAETPEVLTEGEVQGGILRVTLEPTPEARRVKGVAEVVPKGSREGVFVSIDLEIPE